MEHCEENKIEKKSLSLDFKDLVVLISLIGSIAAMFFGSLRDHDSRIVRLETKVEMLTDTLNEIKRDQKEIIKDIKILIGEKK
jgi:archaellum component FlaC